MPAAQRSLVPGLFRSNAAPPRRPSQGAVLILKGFQAARDMCAMAKKSRPAIVYGSTGVFTPPSMLVQAGKARVGEAWKCVSHPRPFYHNGPLEYAVVVVRTGHRGADFRAGLELPEEHADPLPFTHGVRLDAPDAPVWLTGRTWRADTRGRPAVFECLAPDGSTGALRAHELVPLDAFFRVNPESESALRSQLDALESAVSAWKSLNTNPKTGVLEN